MGDDPRTRIEELFQRQQAKRWEVAQRPAAARIAALQRLRQAIQDRRALIIAAIYEDFRKPAAEVEVTELHVTLAEIDHAVVNLADWMAPKPAAGTLMLAGTRSEVRCEPKGVVLVLAPWNYPFMLAMTPLLSAIAAGNCAILKPSEKTPATARAMQELLAATFPEDEVAVVTGGPDVAEALLSHPFDHIFFTGSTAIGRRVMAAAARHLTSVTLELGGKSPAIVDASADVAAAAKRIVWGRFVNGGQTCVAPDHVWVHELVERRFLDEAVAAVRRAYGETEEARRESPDFARVIDDAAFRRLEAMVGRSREAGAQLEVGGVFDAPTRYVAPTILSGVSEDSPSMEDEIFGPVLPVLRFKERAEPIRFTARRDKPLALYVFADDRRAVEEILRGTSAGGTVVNNVAIHLANPNLPFGGTGPSGFGSCHGLYGFRAFSHERAVLWQRNPALSALLEPPYDGKGPRALGKFLRGLEWFGSTSAP